MSGKLIELWKYLILEVQIVDEDQRMNQLKRYLKENAGVARSKKNGIGKLLCIRASESIWKRMNVELGHSIEIIKLKKKIKKLMEQ